MVFLLDVNVLLALFDRKHVHHEPAHAWFGNAGRKGWATCPITENGIIRISSGVGYPGGPGNVPQTADWLRRFCNESGHQFWPDSTSILEWLSPETVISSKQITDLYLLGLAAANGGKLATFDRTVPTKAIKGGAKALELLG